MKILYVTTIGITMRFFDRFVKCLLENGHTVDLACNENDGQQVPACFREWGCTVYPLSCIRSPLHRGNIKAIKEIKKLVKDQQYDIVHCHTPIAAACTRIACRKARKYGTKVFYTAHGLHFYHGAPLKNWLIYYPVEKLCAHFTDVLITINQEDYSRAKRKLKAKSVEYVPGVGIDVDHFANAISDRIAKRKELGIPVDAFLLLSVGELNENKNHQVILRAMAKLQHPRIHYAIAGIGDRKEQLLVLADKLGLSNHVHLLGYRKDVSELCRASDVFCFPSFREGLGLGAIEAMASGLPLVTSNVHGINDYSRDGLTGYRCAPNDVDGFAAGIKCLMESSDLRIAMGEYNQKTARKYDVQCINQKMISLYH